MSTVKQEQQAVAEAGKIIGRAVSRLAAARAKQADVIATQEAVVADAVAGLHSAVVEGAALAGVEMAARLSGIPLAEAKKLVRPKPQVRHQGGAAYG